MAIFIGYRPSDISAIINGVSVKRPYWMASIDFNSKGSGIETEITALGPGIKTHVIAPIFPAITHQGYLAGSYKGVFYDKILIEPTYIDFGSILSTRVQSITVFNGYLTNRTLNNIVQYSFDEGTFFVGDDTPATYLPLEERVHVITVTPDGPPNLSAQIYYDWQGTSDDIAVDFVGSRVVLLQLTMRPGVKERLNWLTNVMISRNGTEQRVRHRLAPRQQFSFEAYVNRNDRNLLENLLYGRVGNQPALPIWTESRFGDPITAGDIAVNVSTLYGDFRIGGLALIWESSRKYHVAQIESFTDTLLISTQEIPQDFDNPIVMPVRVARFLNDPTRTATGFDAVVSINMEVIDNIQLETTASDIQVNGEDFYDEQPLMANMDGVPDKYNTRIDLVDYETGVLSQITPWVYNRITREFELVLEGLEEIWNFRLWLHRRAGRLVPFYMPTFENNLFILDRGTLTDTLTCQNDLYSGQAIDRSRLAFKKTDGSWVFRNVLSASVNEFNQEVIIIDAILNFSYDELDFVSYMGLKRLASDSFELTWLANNVVVVSVPIVEIRP